MVDILHKVGVKSSSPERVYDALATIEGLNGWWTSDTRGRNELGGVLEFHFGRGRIDMKVVELRPGRHIRWEVVGGPEEWIGTSIDWDLEQKGDDVAVRFAHEGWRKRTDLMHHCSTKWATFLLSLKALVETGRGAPHPNDVHIE